MDGLVYAGGMSESMPPAPPRAPKKTSSVRHTRAIQRDRSKRPPLSPPDAEVEARLTALIHPLTLSQVAYYHDLGLRERVLSLPVMVALVLSMIWRQIGSVCTLTRLLRKVGLLRAQETHPLAGRMTGLLDLCARLPRALWYEPDAQAHDQRCWPR